MWLTWTGDMLRSFARMDMLYFIRSDLLYIYFYHLCLIGFVLPKDLVGDHLGVIVGLQYGNSHLLGEDHSSNESLVLRLVIVGDELEL